jgi:hypothetical protein
MGRQAQGRGKKRSQLNDFYSFGSSTLCAKEIEERDRQAHESGGEHFRMYASYIERYDTFIRVSVEASQMLLMLLLLLLLLPAAAACLHTALAGSRAQHGSDHVLRCSACDLHAFPVQVSFESAVCISTCLHHLLYMYAGS